MAAQSEHKLHRNHLHKQCACQLPSKHFNFWKNQAIPEIWQQFWRDNISSDSSFPLYYPKWLGICKNFLNNFFMSIFKHSVSHLEQPKPFVIPVDKPKPFVIPVWLSIGITICCCIMVSALTFAIYWVFVGRKKRSWLFFILIFVANFLYLFQSIMTN